MKITSGNYEVFDTGSVISFENESVMFQLADDLNIHFVFREDSQNINNRLEFESVNNNELRIVLINFTNTLGTGNTSPIHVATLNGRAVYVNFRVYLLNSNNNRTIHYTWYLGEEVNNG